MTVQVSGPAPVGDAARLRTSLTCCPRSRGDAIRYLDAAEAVRETLLRNARPGEVDAFIVARSELLMLKWAHTYRRLLPYARYLAVIDRVEAREPLGWSRRMFDLGTLGDVAELVGELASRPRTVADRFAELPEFQPLAEIRMDGVRGPLVVHIGSIAYVGALAIVSETDCDEDGPLPPLRHRIVRLLGFETPQHGAVIRVSDDARNGIVLVPRGAMTVECVIFNRPDLLSCT